MLKENSLKINDKWLKAAVIGSLWASIEIILGSFLHNLRVPFAGTLLAILGVSLLIAFSHIWNEKGLFWRSGIICALMKSISPSLIILGPMIGIMYEAILLELFILLFGRNIFAYAIGGMFAISSILIQKMITLLIKYGFDIVTVASNFYNYSLHLLNIKNLSPIYLVLLIIILYNILGLVAAFIGYLTGNKYVTSKKSIISFNKIQFSNNKKITENNYNKSYSISLLFLHLILIISCILIINSNIYYFSVIPAILYIGFCLFKYDVSKKIIKKTGLWVQLFIISLLTVIFWNETQNNFFISITGINAAFKMLLRALIIIIGFSAISVELRNPIIKAIMLKKGLSQLYLSLNLAFSALPSIISNISNPKKILRNPFKFLSNIIIQADELLKDFKSHISNNQKIYIITEDEHKGKTTFVKNLVSKLLTKGLNIQGFIAEAVINNKTLSGYNLKNLHNNEKMQLITKEQHDDWLKLGPYYFNSEGFDFGNNILSNKNITNADLIVIDEIGPLELSENGWFNQINNLLTVNSVSMIWVVRKSIIKEVIEKWKISNYEIINISLHNENEMFNKIINIKTA
ncbi:MAG: hypothetical protein KAG95_01525 [Bacteroidales bacterium]|nr:hypothetical protein [Bacteroidales bacterium]